MCPFVFCLHPQGCLRRGVRASGPSQERTGESGAFGMCNSGRIHFQSHVEADSFKFLMRVLLRASVSCLLLTGSCPRLIVKLPSPQAAHNIATSFKANRGKSVFSHEKEMFVMRERVGLECLPRPRAFGNQGRDADNSSQLRF